jgi:hypothetical protein
MTGHRDRAMGSLGQVLPAVAANLAARDKATSPGLPPAVAYWVRTIRTVETELTGGLPRLLRRPLQQQLVEDLAALIVAGIEVVVDDMRRRDEEAAS